MTGQRPPLALTMLDRVEQTLLGLTDVAETMYYLERQSASAINMLCHQQNCCLFIARNSLAIIENANAHTLKMLDDDLGLLQSFINNISLTKRGQMVQFSTIGKQLDRRVANIKHHNNRQLNTLQNENLTRLIHLCPTVRLGQHYIRKAYPKVQQLTDIIDRCFYQTYQLMPEQFLISINDFQFHLLKLIEAYDNATLNDALVKACAPLPEYSLQFARMKLLSFFNTYLLLSDNEKTQLTDIEKQPLSNSNIDRAIDLVNKKHDELITNTHLVSGEHHE